MSTQYKDKYGNWAGNPRGNAPDFTLCAEEVWPAGVWQSYQCSRKCGHGPEGAYCKQHAKRYKDDSQ